MFGVVDCAVDVYFGVDNSDGGGAWITWVVEFVFSGFHADAVSFCFLWVYVADEVGAGIFSAGGNSVLAYREDGACAFYLFVVWSVLSDAVW